MSRVVTEFIAYYNGEQFLAAKPNGTLQEGSATFTPETTMYNGQISHLGKLDYEEAYGAFEFDLSCTLEQKAQVKRFFKFGKELSRPFSLLDKNGGQIAFFQDAVIEKIPEFKMGSDNSTTVKILELKN